MSEFQYKAGLNHVGAYQISGIPFAVGGLTAPATASAPISVEFPSVTKFITVTNLDSSNAVRVGFSENGIKGSNYITVPPQTSLTLDLRVTKIFILSDDGALSTAISVAAGLTGITGYDLATTYSGSNGIG